MNGIRGNLTEHENRGQETLHPLNDDITKESNPKNLSVPTEYQSNGMLNSCTATADVQEETMSSLKMRDASALYFLTRSDDSINEVSRRKQHRRKFTEKHC